MAEKEPQPFNVPQFTARDYNAFFAAGESTAKVLVESSILLSNRCLVCHVRTERLSQYSC